MRAGAFFSPRLAPVLERGTGAKDTVVAPQVPTRWAVGHAVLDHHPPRQSDPAVRGVTARWRQISEVGAQVLATLRTGMLCLRDEQITRTPHVEMAQVVQRPMRRLVPLGRGPTARTRLPDGVATVGDALRLGHVSGRRDPCARVGSVRTGTEHRVALLAQWFGPELYDQRLLGATRSPRYSLGFLVQTSSFRCKPDFWCKAGRSYWIPGSYAPALSEKHNAFFRLCKNKGFKEESMTKVGLYAIGTSTTLESNKSHPP